MKVYMLDKSRRQQNSPLRGHPHQEALRHYQETCEERKRTDVVVLVMAVASVEQTMSLETMISPRVEQMQIQNYITPVANIATEAVAVETFELPLLDVAVSFARLCPCLTPIAPRFCAKNLWNP